MARHRCRRLRLPQIRRDRTQGYRYYWLTAYCDDHSHRQCVSKSHFIAHVPFQFTSQDGVIASKTSQWRMEWFLDYTVRVTNPKIVHALKVARLTGQLRNLTK